MYNLLSAGLAHERVHAVLIQDMLSSNVIKTRMLPSVCRTVWRRGTRSTTHFARSRFQCVFFKTLLNRLAAAEERAALAEAAIEER